MPASDNLKIRIHVGSKPASEESVYPPLTAVMEPGPIQFQELEAPRVWRH